MSRRRLRRRIARAQRRPTEPALAPAAALPDSIDQVAEWFRPAPAGVDEPAVIVREAQHVERLAYTRTQAAQALGIGRSTFTQRVLPYIETIETPWGAKLIPADELMRIMVEWRRPARPRPKPKRAGRPRAVAPDVAERIREARAAGLSLRQIADSLNADRITTAQGGVRWWPSTVRSVLGR